MALSGREDISESAKWFNIGHNTKVSASLIAIILTSIKCSINTPLTIYIRSGMVLDLLTKDMEKMEDEGFYGIQDAGLLRTLVGQLRMHRASIALYNLTDELIFQQETLARSLATNALTRDRIMTLPPIPEELHLTGARLSSMTQALAYKTIKSMTECPERPRTQKMLKDIMQHIKNSEGRMVEGKTIWKGIRNKDFSKKVKIFLWKLTHDAYKVGQYWDRPTMNQELKSRAFCKHNNNIDSMDYILTKCVSPEQDIVWNLASNMWKRKSGEPLGPQTPTTIIGSTVRKVESTDKVKVAGLTRLLRILIVESAYLI